MSTLCESFNVLLVKPRLLFILFLAFFSLQEDLTQEMNDDDETPEERLENMRRFREWLRNHDHAASLQRYRVKLNRQLGNLKHQR
jgi:hypothetical protein